MKLVLSIIIAAAVLAGCAIPGTHGNTGAPKSASFAGAKGVYTDSGTTARSVFGVDAAPYRHPDGNWYAARMGRAEYTQTVSNGVVVYKGEL